jgi:linoleoyl-CoA desaturase
MTRPAFQPGQQVFFAALKGKVDHYFRSNRLNTSGGRPLYVKSGIQIASTVALYTVLVFLRPAPWLAVPLAVLLGIHLAMLGFNIMHEGGHQCFSRRRWLNQAAGFSLNVLGGNIFFWKVKHNVNHHTFTNIQGFDSDINVEPFMRLHPDQPWYKGHRFQHIYWVFLYGVSYAAWVFYEDFVKYFSQRVAGHMEKKSLPLREHLIFWVTKILYAGVFIAAPVYFTGWVYGLTGFVIVSFSCGLFISIVFQLAHVVEATHFPSSSVKAHSVEVEWAVHQVQTTANFATRNKLLFWALGGLNFQVEHHLFPRISHIHYPAISRYVRETCAEFNITYQEYNTMWAAFLSHLAFLKRAGNPVVVRC